MKGEQRREREKVVVGRSKLSQFLLSTKKMAEEEEEEEEEGLVPIPPSPPFLSSFFSQRVKLMAFLTLP